MKKHNKNGADLLLADQHRFLLIFFAFLQCFFLCRFAIKQQALKPHLAIRAMVFKKVACTEGAEKDLAFAREVVGVFGASKMLDTVANAENVRFDLIGIDTVNLGSPASEVYGDLGAGLYTPAGAFALQGDDFHFCDSTFSVPAKEHLRDAELEENKDI